MNARSLFDKTTFECSKLITQRYSTSFTLGIKTLDKKFHLPIYAVYGFVRYADEIVDTFHDKDKKALLDRFKSDAYEAIDERISLLIHCCCALAKGPKAHSTNRKSARGSQG